VVEKILLASDGPGALTAAAVAHLVAGCPVLVVREPGFRL
jgi:hypothetical protein